MKKAYSVIQNKNKFSKDDYFKAVMDLRYTYKYSFKDLKKADEVLSYLDSDSEKPNKKPSKIHKDSDSDKELRDLQASFNRRVTRKHQQKLTNIFV